MCEAIAATSVPTSPALTFNPETQAVVDRIGEVVAQHETEFAKIERTMTEEFESFEFCHRGPFATDDRAGDRLLGGNEIGEFRIEFSDAGIIDAAEDIRPQVSMYLLMLAERLREAARRVDPEHDSFVRRCGLDDRRRRFVVIEGDEITMRSSSATNVANWLAEFPEAQAFERVKFQRR